MEQPWGWGSECEKIGAIGSRNVGKFYPYAALEDERTGCTWGVKLKHNATWQIELSRCATPLSLSAGIGDYKKRARDMELMSFEENDNCAVSRYSNGRLSAVVERFFKDNGNLCERYTLKNISDCDLFLEQDNCGIVVPFTDRYTDAEDCMINRCNTHIWCGHNTAYINALKMGLSDNNIGLVLTKGAIDSYSVIKHHDDGNYRGEFIMNTAHTELLTGEEYVIEWELFHCRGVEDFYYKIKEYPSYIGVKQSILPYLKTRICWEYMKKSLNV